MLKCFYDYRFTAEMQKAFDGADRFFELDDVGSGDPDAQRPVGKHGGELANVIHHILPRGARSSSIRPRRE